MQAVLQLYSIRRDPKKFICINDNIDHRQDSAAEVVAALQNFYQALFPIRSQFELPEGYRNRFLHTADLRAWREEQANVLLWARVAFAVLVLLCIASLYSGKIKQMRRTWLQWRHRQRTTTSASRLHASSPFSPASPSAVAAAKRLL